VIPIVPIEPLDLPRIGPHHDDLWTTLCDLGDAHEEDWLVIGGQMVMLHALQAGREPGRVSQDLDTVIDARVRPPALPAFLATLANLGFKSAGVSPDEVAHRFERGSVHVDVLGPDGLGGRSDLRTTGTATTIQVGGGTQALQRAERVPVRHSDRVVHVPRPNLVGAIVIKAAAAHHDPHPQRHVRDIAFLCSIVTDPDAMRTDMSAKDLQRLRAVNELDDPRNEAWRLLDDPELGYTAFRILVGATGSPASVTTKRTSDLAQCHVRG
jgi:hypothetical protein